MFGLFLLFIYHVVRVVTMALPPRLGRALRARVALRFSSLSDGGLDDDFAEELFQVVRRDPALLPVLDARETGEGWFARRRRLTLNSVRHALALDATSMF